MAWSGDGSSGRVLVRTLGAILDHARTFPSLPAAGVPSLDDDFTGSLATRHRHRRRLGETHPWFSSEARFVEVVRRADLAWGDSLFVTTKNSHYCINPAGRSWFVWGGWFQRHGHVPAIVGINGCTWGGSVIHSDILAAPGLFLEFANGVTTTRIQSVLLVPAGRGAGYGA